MKTMQQRDPGEDGTSGFEDFYDIEDLRASGMRVITAQDFEVGEGAAAAQFTKFTAVYPSTCASLFRKLTRVDVGTSKCCG